MLKNISNYVKPNCRTFFDGFGRVLIGNKCEKLVKNIQEGDEILTPYGMDKIKSITRFCPNVGYIEVVELNRMLITPEHEIKIYDEWIFPKEMKEIKFMRCSEMFSFKLDKYDVLTINGNNVKA